MQQNFTHKSVLESSCSDLNVSGTIIDTDNGTFNDLDSSEVFLPNTDFLDEEWSKIDNKSLLYDIATKLGTLINLDCLKTGKVYNSITETTT